MELRNLSEVSGPLDLVDLKKTVKQDDMIDLGALVPRLSITGSASTFDMSCAVLTTPDSCCNAVLSKNLAMLHEAEHMKQFSSPDRHDCMDLERMSGPGVSVSACQDWLGRKS